MAVSKAQKRATAKFEQQNYDKVLLRMPKGKRENIKSYAESRGESLNGFINRAIYETIKRDNK